MAAPINDYFQKSLERALLFYTFAKFAYGPETNRVQISNMCHDNKKQEGQGRDA